MTIDVKWMPERDLRWWRSPGWRLSDHVRRSCVLQTTVKAASPASNEESIDMFGIEVNLQGATRKVHLTSRWAVKTPYFRWGWKNFLIGLLSNMQEVKFSNLSPDKLCPVRWHIPGGFLLVMPRGQVMSAEYFAQQFDYETFVQEPGWTLPVESKWNSFGWLDGRIVAIDYGTLT